MRLIQLSKPGSSLLRHRLCVPDSVEPNKRNPEQGSALIEFVLVAFVLFLLIFGIVEMERMLLVYTTLANAARGGVRYAIVHGSDRSGSGVNGPSTSSSHTNIDNTVKALAGTGALNTANLQITVTYTPSSSNAPGTLVSVRVVYPYDPFTVLPLSVNLSSVSEGVVTF